MICARSAGRLPEVEAGCDLAQMIVTSLPESLRDGEIVVVAHKAISKAEGAIVSLADLKPGPFACRLAAEHGKDPRLVEVILSQTRRLIRASRGVLICETHHGFVCANAGVDRSNAPGEDVAITLPADPDASARTLRTSLSKHAGDRLLGVVITDSFGCAWRLGQCDVAIGVAGVAPLDDWRGRQDANGRELHATQLAIADQLAALADLARAKDTYEPVVIISGAERHVTAQDGPGAGALLRARAEDLFR
jgi:coenzyme F420-0:L-glutamate ligase/coenzyme F420-1:gamma-L-glutamate ligase